MTTRKPLRLLVAINSLGAGGTERSTALLLPRLQFHEIEPQVVTLKREGLGDEAAVRESGIPVHVLDSQSLAGRIREMRRVIREAQPDLIHTAIFDADVVGRVAAIRTGVPVLSSLVNTPYEPERYRDPNVRSGKLNVLKSIDGWTGRHLTTHFHAVSEGVAQANINALRLDPERVTVVDRGRDVSRFTQVGGDVEARRVIRAEVGADEATPVLLAVGRQEFQKAHDDLVRAFAQMANARTILVIAGREGNGSPALREQISATPPSVSSRIRVLGHRTDIAELLAGADAFVMPSRYEGTAGAAIEALAAGVPVLHSDVPGVRGVLVDGENARLVPPGEPTVLAAAMDQLLEDTALRSAVVDGGRRTVAERFDIDRSTSLMADLYRSVASWQCRDRRRPSSRLIR